MKKEPASYQPVFDRWSYLWLAVGTLLMAFVAGSWPIALAAWLAPLFFLRFMHTQKLWRGTLLTMIGLSVAYTIGWWVQNPMSAMLPAPAFGFIAALLPSLAFLVDRLLAPRLRAPYGGMRFSTTLIYPLFWTAAEFLLYTNMIYGAYGSSANAFHSSPGLMQLTSITGLWGLTFLPAWFASVANWAWGRAFSWREMHSGAAVFGSVLLLVLAYGDIRLTLASTQGNVVRVHTLTALEEYGGALIVGEMGSLFKTDMETLRSKTASMSVRYIEGTIREARAGAQIVVWPEASVVGIPEDIDALAARAGEVAREQNIYLAIGPYILHPEGELDELRLMVFDPAGKMVLNHLKYAYGWSGAPLSEAQLQTVDTPYGRLSGVLCGDLDFPGVVKQAGQKGVDILLVPSMEGDPDDSNWHVKYAAFRSVENGLSLVRPTAGGVSIAIDPYGRTLAWMDHHTTDNRVMVAQVPTQRVFTFYAMAGDLFAWLSVVGFLFIAGWAIFRGHKTTSEETHHAAD